MQRRGGGYCSILMLRPAAFAPVLVAALALAATAPGQRADAAELATARGTIAIAAAASPAIGCEDLVVEARGALDAHIIALSRPVVGSDGACRYAITVPAQAAVWLSVHTGAVLEPVNAARLNPAVLRARPGRPASASVALRFTLIAATTYIFTPGEEKTVPLAFGTPPNAPA